MKALRFLLLLLVFVIAETASAFVIVQSPNGGEAYNPLSPQFITWSTSAPYVSIEYSTDNGASWNVVVSSTPGSSGYLGWNIPSTASTFCLLRISDAANSSDFDVSNSTWSIGSTASFTLSLNSTSPSCYGGANGTASVGVFGGTAPFTYFWNPGNYTTQSIGGLAAGIYSVTVTDNSGGTLTESFSISQPGILNAIYNATNSCAGACTGEATISVGGGSTPYSYSWSTGAVTPTQSNLCAGTYTFSVTDANGCVTGDQVLITNNMFNLSASASPSAVCQYQSTNLTVTSVAGAVYSWSPATGLSSTTTPNPTAVPTVSMTYTAYVTYNGCTESATVPITVNPNPTATLSSSSPSICLGSSVTIAASGSGIISYIWNPGGSTASSLVSTPPSTGPVNFTVTVTDANGCIDTEMTTIQVNPIPSVTTSSVPASCGGASDGSATAIVTGGSGPYFFSWSPAGNASTITAPAGTYQVTVTDANGCTGLANPTTITDSCGYVWPGDANEDLIVDNDDILSIGLAFGSSGPLRQNASLMWVGQYAADWNDTLPSGINHKYSDCNGDGLVSYSDTLAVSQNYGSIHNYRALPLTAITGANIYLQASADSTGESSTVDVNIDLGNAQNPVDSIYGISFTINYDPSLVDPQFTHIDFISSWFGVSGSNMISFGKHLPAQGKTVVAITGTDHLNRSGQGHVGTFRIVTTDNLSGITPIEFTVTDIYAITRNENAVQVGAVHDTVVIDPLLTSMKKDHLAVIKVYPNPSNGSVTLAGISEVVEIDVRDLAGKLVLTEKLSQTGAIDLSAFGKGVYIMKLTTAGRSRFEKIVIN